MATLAMATIETEYEGFAIAMDSTRSGKSELMAVLNRLIQQAMPENDAERINLGECLAGMLCKYKGDFERELRGSPSYANENKALNNAITYVRTQSMALINANAKKEEFAKIKISGFTNRPKGDDYRYQMDVSLAKSETKTEPEAIPEVEGTVEDSIAAMDATLEDMMKAVVSKYTLEQVAAWVLAQ
jgi:hypothetical protein